MNKKYSLEAQELRKYSHDSHGVNWITHLNFQRSFTVEKLAQSSKNHFLQKFRNRDGFPTVASAVVKDVRGGLAFISNEFCRWEVGHPFVHMQAKGPGEFNFFPSSGGQACPSRHGHSPSPQLRICKISPPSCLPWRRSWNVYGFDLRWSPRALCWAILVYVSVFGSCSRIRKINLLFQKSFQLFQGRIKWFPKKWRTPQKYFQRPPLCGGTWLLHAIS